MGQYFHGYLAGLSILKNQTESDRVIQCLNNCQEKLDFTAIDEMETGMVCCVESIIEIYKKRSVYSVANMYPVSK